jgi:hypothetical protein
MKGGIMGTKKVKCMISVAVIFFLYSSQVFSMNSSLAALGEVMGSGNAEMKTAFNRWLTITGKSCPIVDGANLKSGKGKMSVVMRDGVTIEVGADSYAIINGSIGNYVIKLSSGGVAFSIPKSISFSVITPTSIVRVQSADKGIQKVNTSTDYYAKGAVIYDGKGTKVISVGGTFMVEDTTGKGMQILTSGNSIYVDEIGNASRVTPVQLSETEEAGSDDTKLLKIIGITALVLGGGIAVAAAMSGGDGGGDGSASPSRP